MSVNLVANRGLNGVIYTQRKIVKSYLCFLSQPMTLKSGQPFAFFLLQKYNTMYNTSQTRRLESKSSHGT